MNLGDLCKHIRTKSEPLRVDDVTVETGTETFLAHGTIHVEKDGFKLRLTIENGECPLPEGTFTSDQFWKISGFIDDEFAFSTSGMPHSTPSGFTDRAYNRGLFRVHSLSLGKDLSLKEIEEKEVHLAKMLQFFPEDRRPKITANPALIPQEEPVRIWHHARLIKYPLLWKNAETKTSSEGPLKTKQSNSSKDAFTIKFEGCEFLLKQEEEDCLINVFQGKDTAIEAEHLEKIFNCLLWAVAFVSGKDAWPQEVKVSTRYKTLKHTLTVPREAKRSRSALLNETACANGADFGDALKCATQFFMKNEELGETIHEMLYLSRSATSVQTPYEVGTLALCSIFEGLVDLFDEHFLSDLEHENEAVFNEAKKEVQSACNSLKSALSPDAAAKAQSYDRLSGAIGAARFARFKEKLIRLVCHLGLDWDGCFELALSAWQKNRNAKAHGKLASGSKFEFRSQSRIAGAINLLTASAMGYKGLAIFSASEDKYKRI